MDPSIGANAGASSESANPVSTGSVVDARPILRRTEDNPWDRTEQIRARLYHFIEATCQGLGFEALVLQSDPYIHPAWVKVESWKPARGGALTGRAAMTVTITAVPYHRYGAVYKVEWEKLGRRGVVDHLYGFGEREVSQMLHFLWTEPSVPMFGDAVRSILSPGQLRTEWWHLWKPTNKPVALRHDWLQIGSLLVLAAGTLLLFAGYVETSGSRAEVGTYDGLTVADTVAVTDTTAAAPAWADTTMLTTPVDTTMVTVPTTDTTMAPAVEPATAPLYADQEVTGRLEPADRTFSDTGAFYDGWTYQAQAGERIVATMRSSDFNPVLALLQFRDGQWVNVGVNAAADATSARVEMLAPNTGDYLVAAGSSPGQTGSYTLRVDRVGTP